eukprot:XP_001707271.1 Hypothetical protein GL50803_32386 [Giardia lamblia ATCC 50803]
MISLCVVTATGTRKHTASTNSDALSSKICFSLKRTKLPGSSTLFSTRMLLRARFTSCRDAAKASRTNSLRVLSIQPRKFVINLACSAPRASNFAVRTASEPISAPDRIKPRSLKWVKVWPMFIKPNALAIFSAALFFALLHGSDSTTTVPAMHS